MEDDFCGRPGVTEPNVDSNGSSEASAKSDSSLCEEKRNGLTIQSILNVCYTNPDFIRSIVKGRRLVAIKILRSALLIPLREAKEMCEEFIRFYELPEFPDKGESCVCMDSVRVAGLECKVRELEERAVALEAEVVRRQRMAHYYRRVLQDFASHYKR